jgi:hypothetical protein
MTIVSPAHIAREFTSVSKALSCRHPNTACMLALTASLLLARLLMRMYADMR